TEKIITNSITEDQAGCLWISSVKGVLKYNPKTKDMIRYIDNLNVNSILTTRDEIYIGTDIGLLAIGAKGDSTLLTTKDGLCGDDITTITEGCNGEIWISNDSGISRYSIADKTFHNYYIQSSNCSTARSEDGTLFFGNNKSITYFNPSELSDFYHHISGRKITITELKIAGEIISVGDTINGNVILDKPLEHTDKIVLNYKNNNFSLCVSNLLFNSVHQRCMYRMLPIQPNWTVINSSESISYMALPEGTYTFHVKDYSKGNNKTPVTELKIRIKSHWMFSLPTKIISALLLVIFLFMIFVRTRVRYKRQLYLSQLNSELKSQRVKLDRERKINRERINFFTYASHELRTPLTLIISPIQELLSDKKLMTHAKDKLLTIEQNAQSLLNITDKLLDFQQIDAKITKLNISKIDILELLKTIISNFHSLCTENNIETTLTTTTDVPQLWLYADRQKIESAISNLISNSIKYRSPTEPKIEISVGVSNIDNIDFITVLIKDNGQGISDKAQKTIFESFSTDNNKPLLSTKIGVGLYIVRSIIELHHGTISLVSDIDKGTTFSVQIPQDYKYFDNDKSLSNLPNETIKKVDIKEKKTILIVEDNADILDYINSLFCNTYNVLTSNNGEDGLAIAKDKLPDIILQDVMLPGISGIECCSQLIHNSETSHIPIILLSAKADELSIMEGSMAGAADYIIKPFNPQILKAKVSSLISSRQMLKQIYAKTLMLNGESVHKVFENNFMQQLINITEQNLTNPEFSVELLAEKLNISTSTLRRNIKSYSDLPVNNIIRDVRLTKAASLIMTQKYRVVEIAEMVGYNDISSFRVQFTKKFGISPSKFHNT
ncbi:MAG: response regulator, partial [Rikenellaceae bacterium]